MDQDAGSGGIFADLLPKSAAVGNMDEHLSDSPTFTLIEEEPDLLGVDLFVPDVASRSFEPKAGRPAARKVHLDEIPAGHVDLSDRERKASVFGEFDIEDPERFVGKTVKGRYVVSQSLGGDEMGLSYLADDQIGDRKVLVRILLGGEPDDTISAILAEERVSLSHFSHPHIARLIDSGAFTNGTQFLISEHSDALSLRDILDIHGALDPDRAGRIVRQAAQALSGAHQAGIVHRDLRPENLILTNDNDVESVKLVNFGASTGEPTERNAAYKAPEVLEGRMPTAASDVYSLGVVAFEMLTGSLPFEAPTAKELLRSKYAGLQTRPSQLRSAVVSGVDPILERAMSIKATDRYAKARDLGDALFAVLETAEGGKVPVQTAPSRKIEVLKPLETLRRKRAEPAWKSRSPEPPQEETSRAKVIGAVAGAVLLGLLVFGWYYVVSHPSETSVPPTAPIANDQPSTPTISSDVEMPPQPRKITQPPNSEYFANSKQNLRDDLLRNFVGFSLYYPKDWKVNPPQAGTAGSRGKFLDIARLTPDGTPKEQMLVSYYPSKGTFNADSPEFAQMVKETNETLKKILPGYQMLSEGEIKVNGDWRAYEVKFTSSGTAANGERIDVWGRRLFIPAARGGVRNGFEITMLATSLSEDVKSVEDVGVRGELAPILYSFEPSQNF